jgi:hypothetical protein
MLEPENVSGLEPPRPRFRIPASETEDSDSRCPRPPRPFAFEASETIESETIEFETSESEALVIEALKFRDRDLNPFE